MEKAQCDGCSKFARYKAGAQAQIASVTAEKEALETDRQTWKAEKSELQREIKRLQALLGMDSETGGLGDKSRSAAEEASAGVRLSGDVLSDGAFDFPAECAADWTPKAAANVVSLAAIAINSNSNDSSIVGNIKGAGRSKTDPSYLVLAGCADKTVHLATLQTTTATTASIHHDAADDDDDDTIRETAKSEAASESTTHAAHGMQFSPIASVLLDAPALCLSPNNNTNNTNNSNNIHNSNHASTGTLVAAGLMNGHLAMLRVHSEGVEVLGVTQLHAKYLTTACWSPCGLHLATASHDKSICILRVQHGTNSSDIGEDAPAEAIDSVMPACSVSVVQRLYFKGNVEALSWHGTTLVAAVRGMPVLYYITVFNARNACAVNILTATEVPVQMPDAVEERLFVHRVPISEDGPKLNILHDATTDSTYDVPSMTTFPGIDGPLSDALADLDLSEGGMYIPVGFNIVDICAPQADSTSLFSGTEYLAAAADNGIIYVFKWGTNQLVRRLVGHNVSTSLQSSTRLAWHPSHADYLIASSDRDFALCVFSVGSGKVVSKLGIGQPRLSLQLPLTGVRDALAQASRYGHNLDTSNPADTPSDSSSGPGTAAQRHIHSHSQSQGHRGAIKDLSWLTPHLLLSCGFDKRVLAWGPPQ